MQKISKHTIFDDVLYEPEDRENSNPGVAINMTPGAVIGALTGANIASVLAKRKAHNDAIMASLPKAPPQVQPNFANKSYYTQVANVVSNLSVTFTPVTVIYTVKDGKQDVTIDMIRVDEMSPQMHLAWVNRDSDYFKNILINKMRSDVQVVEQHFANRLLQKHFKTASESVTSLLDKTAAAKHYYEQQPDLADKAAEAFVKMSADAEIDLELKLDRPFTDYADAEASYDFLSYNEKYASFANQKLSQPNYLISHLKTVYFPDRIIFVVDNKAILTLHNSEMTAEQFEKFKLQDSKFFKKWFEGSVKSAPRINKFASETLPEDTQASVPQLSLTADPRSAFLLTEANPVLYLLLLNQKYGQEWMTFEPMALIKMIEEDFNLTEGVSDLVLNKILAVRSCNASFAPYDNAHAFEKMIRCFNGLPIDWLISENDDIEPKDIAYGLETFDLVTPDDDTYDNFSLPVFKYIVDLLVSSNCLFFWPDKNSSKSPLHEAFYLELNQYLLDASIASAVADISDLQQRSEAVARQELLHSLIHDILNDIRSNQSYTLNDKNLLKIVKSAGQDESLLYLAKMQVVLNTEVDEYMQDRMGLFSAQMNIYGLSLQAEETIE